MGQSIRSCPSCHTPLEAGQRFCSNCGTVLEGSAHQQTERTPAESISRESTRIEPQYTPPPPPPVYAQAPQPGQQIYNTPISSYSGGKSPSQGKVLGQIGCGMLAIILVVLAACGGISYFGYQWIASQASKSNTSTNNTGDGNSSYATPTSAPAVTTNISTKPVMYSSVNITVLSAQQATSLPGDNGGDGKGLIRLNIKEENTSSKTAGYYYGDAAHLIMPNGDNIAVSSSQAFSGPEASIKRTNWLDFPVATSVKPDQLILRLGTSTESQIDIPLKGNADLSKYQAKTATPNKQTQYSNVTWTITNATSQLSYAGKQAESGKCYIVLQLRMDNTSSTTFNAYYGDYIRLKSGDTLNSPDGNSNLPTAINANQSNITGTAVFLMPQGTTDFSFILLNTPSTGSVPQQTIDFQIA
ncbi:zinc ribbon domain-containing protein [Ktedonospora formicarum]|uniref:Zinc-ribbon domain-containing protein n=1 Tax=Ktedonospora formicarum TaxID=2778364 RepID=A0A8J3HUQ1_9CHLR|nr:zinc ribbon domain-containing protein [Ktedonospora formicarum]GHO42331.1 hypothetical protein KSX_04940 [Ktedonospora formicarum]